jgi:hypothetical protein
MMFVVSSDETAAAAETPRAADMILRRGGVKKKARDGEGSKPAFGLPSWPGLSRPSTSF